jgi:phage repressor protein C with HTH and peptisase S24 domain
MNDAATDVIADLLGRGHNVRFQARGDSMHPAIRDDDYLHVEPIADVAHVRRGEVIVMLADRGLTVHRLLAHRGNDVIARGDNAPGIDPPLHRSRVIGRVAAIERGGQVRKLRRSLFLPALYRWLRTTVSSRA